MKPIKRIWILAGMSFLLIQGGFVNAAESIYDFNMKTLDGNPAPLSQYRGKALLVVNVASKCGFTPQYKDLQALYEKYQGRGFEILAFPANDFKQQEPGTDAEIKKFCELNYGVTFPVFSKISVKGSGRHPLYAYLTQDSEMPGEITWNFNKFLVSPEGRVVARYESKVNPEDEELVGQLEAILPASETRNN